MALPTSSIGGSYNNAVSANSSQNIARTYGTEATSAARASAAAANEAAIERWKLAAEFNAEEAQKQRDWQERMANTVYQRTMADMRSAGLNPVLAAGAGLGTASVGGGSAASIASPETYMANTYADAMSSGSSVGSSESHGQSWNESGFATFLTSMAELAQGIMGGLNSSHTINIALEGLESAKKSVEDFTNPYSYAKSYIGEDGTGKPKEGFTHHYDSEKKTYLTEKEVEEESFVDGLIRGIKNKTNALLGIR